MARVLPYPHGSLLGGGEGRRLERGPPFIWFLCFSENMKGVHRVHSVCNPFQGVDVMKKQEMALIYHGALTTHPHHSENARSHII